MDCEQPIQVFIEGGEQQVDVLQEGGEQNVGVNSECLIVTEATSYNRLYDKPQINGVELIGNRTSEEIHVQHEMDDITNQEIDNIIYA